MRVQWIEHNGQKILFEDYSSLSAERALDVLYESEKIIAAQSEPVRVLLDFTDTMVDTRFMNEIKRIGKKYDSLLKCSANVGVTGVKKILANGYLKFTGQGYKVKYFNTLDEARSFLSAF